MPGSSPTRGIALITALLSVVLVMALLAVMVDIGTARLCEINEEQHAAQALGAADAGASWVRALFEQNYGNITEVLSDLSAAHNTITIVIDSSTSGSVLVSLVLSGPTTNPDHLDINLQENPQILETPLQVVATATITTSGQVVATRTVTTLLRRFQHSAPYSEIVGVVDEGGPQLTLSPGDPAGQVGGAYATDLRMQAYAESGSGSPIPANIFKSDSWSDGNPGSSGLLP